MDRFETLRAFVQVAESGNLSKAAEALQVAVSAVSRRITELEQRLGTQLLQRTTRQMRLTPAGEQFRVRACQILQSLEEAEAEAAGQAQALAGPLRMAAPLSFGQTHLTPILIDFAREHEQVMLDVDFSDRQVDLVAEGHDLAIRIGNLSDSSLIARKLAEVRLIVSASPAFWETYGVPDTPHDLLGLPALCYTGAQRVDVWNCTDPDGKDHALEMNVAMRATNGGYLCNAAMAGMGVVLQPSFICHEWISDGRLQPVLLDHAWPTVTIFAVYPQTRHLSMRARAFIDYARARIGSAPAWEDCLKPFTPGSSSGLS